MAERTMERPDRFVELAWIRFTGTFEVELLHLIEGDEVNVRVRDLESGDHHRDPAAVKPIGQRPADLLPNREEVIHNRRLQVKPVVDLLPRNDQGMAWLHRVDAEKRHADVVLPHEPSW